MKNETLEKIIEYTNEVFKIDIRNQTRKRNYVEARAFYYELARKITNYTLADIGKPLGKDHSTVLYGLMNIVQFLDEKEIQKGFANFSWFEDEDKTSFSYIYKQNKQLKKELNKKNAVLALLPQLELVYDKMNLENDFITDIIKRRSEYYLTRAGDYVNELNNKIKEISKI
jgi:hypothetical protein